MRKLFLIAVLFISLQSLGQNNVFEYLNFDSAYPIINNFCTIEKVGESKYNADEIFDRSKQWIVTNFKSAKDVIELDDKQNHHLMGKGNFDFKTSFWLDAIQNISFIVDIQSKDNKYRIRFYQIVNIGHFNHTYFQNTIESLGVTLKSKQSKRLKRLLYEERERFDKLLESYTSFLNSDKKADDF